MPFVRPATVHEVAGEITVQLPALSPVETFIAVTVKLVGRPPEPEPAPSSIVTEPLDAVSVSTGASGALGSQTAIKVVFAIAVNDSEGSINSIPVDHALKVWRVREIPVASETSTSVFGSTICVEGAIPDVAPAIEYVMPMSAPLHCAVKLTPLAGIVYVEPAATVLLPSLQPRKFTVGSECVGAAARVKVDPKATGDCVGGVLFPVVTSYVTAYVAATHCAVRVKFSAGIVIGVELSY